MNVKQEIEEIRHARKESVLRKEIITLVSDLNTELSKIGTKEKRMDLDQINSKIRVLETQVKIVTCDDEYFTLTDEIDRLYQMADEYEKDGE